MCANVRRLARLATRLYDEELRPSGLEIGQFALLATLRRSKELTQHRLAVGLGMDTSSLTRTLALMVRRGWIEKGTGTDKRTRVFRATPAGLDQFQRAAPLWQRAQRRIADLLGETEAGTLTRLVNDAARGLARAEQRAPAGRTRR